MKRYYNSTTHKWYKEGQIITKDVENGVFSGVPSEEQLSEWGYVEWHEHEPSEEFLLNTARNQKINALCAYNESEEVNSFFLGETTMWLTFDERCRLKEAVDAKEVLGKETMTKNWGGQEYTFSLSVWKQMLAALEEYAYDCQNVTDTHRAAIQQFQTVSDVEDYDFTTGYPNKIVIDYGNNNA